MVANQWHSWCSNFVEDTLKFYYSSNLILQFEWTPKGASSCQAHPLFLKNGQDFSSMNPNYFNSVWEYSSSSSLDDLLEKCRWRWLSTKNLFVPNSWSADEFPNKLSYLKILNSDRHLIKLSLRDIDGWGINSVWCERTRFEKICNQFWAVSLGCFDDNNRCVRWVIINLYFLQMQINGFSWYPNELFVEECE